MTYILSEVATIFHLVGLPLMPVDTLTPLPFGLDWATNILKGIVEGLLEWLSDAFAGEVLKYLHIRPLSEDVAARQTYDENAATAVQLAVLIIGIGVASGPFADAEDFSIGTLLTRVAVFLISLPIAKEILPIFIMTINAVTVELYPDSFHMVFGGGGVMGNLQALGLSALGLVIGGAFVGSISLIGIFIGLLGLQAREFAYIVFFIGYPFISLCRLIPWRPLGMLNSFSRMITFGVWSLILTGPLIALGLQAGSMVMDATGTSSYWVRFLTWFLTIAMVGILPLKAAASVQFTMGKVSGSSGDSSSSATSSSSSESGTSLRDQAMSAARSGANRFGSKARSKFNSAGGPFDGMTVGGLSNAASQKASSFKGKVSDHVPDEAMNAAQVGASGLSRVADVGKAGAVHAAKNPDSSLKHFLSKSAEPLRDDPVVDTGEASGEAAGAGQGAGYGRAGENGSHRRSSSGPSSGDTGKSTNRSGSASQSSSTGQYSSRSGNKAGRSSASSTSSGASGGSGSSSESGQKASDPQGGRSSERRYRKDSRPDSNDFLNS